MQNQIDAIERRPVPQTMYDQYPTIEWGAVPRSQVNNNEWTSTGVANVTGLKYDRVEIKYITYLVNKGRSEAEIRLAAFRHDYNSQYKQCISASQTIRLVGDTPTGESWAYLHAGKWRWQHGIQFGWNHGTDDTGIYTIEMQHRNPNDCLQRGDSQLQVYGFYKYSDQPVPDGISDWRPMNVTNDNGADYRILAQRKAKGTPDNWPGDAGWVGVSDPWDGAYNISNMHYCVGLSQERLPGATREGWHWYTGNAKIARAANVNEPYFSV
ncbi:hypothetical protein [Kitasatospora sp. NPDC001132]